MAVGLTLAAAVVIALLVRGGTALVGLAVLCLLFIPLERWFALRPQKLLRPHLATDLTHFFIDNFLVTIGGIVLGNTMTATSLAAKRALDAVDQRRGEVEAALSLGLEERDSRMLVVRETAADALLPGLDQTRTVGLVTLPGAFVGVLLASGSAVQAGAVQILVLVGLLLAQTCSVATTMELVARGLVRR